MGKSCENVLSSVDGCMVSTSLEQEVEISSNTEEVLNTLRSNKSSVPSYDL